jgi:hypothetical protein
LRSQVAAECIFLRSLALASIDKIAMKHLATGSQARIDALRAVPIGTCIDQLPPLVYSMLYD